MPGLAHRNDHYSFGFWSKDKDGVSYNQLQKFWSELAPKARQELIRVDKQTLFEQARKNMYCSRCNGLLLEGFLQIVMYGKSLQHEESIGNSLNNSSGISKDQNDWNQVITNGCADMMQDPYVHPWGGLTTTRDGSLTLVDCYLYAKSLKGLENVFDSARVRETERELLYPDACGGGGRGWISQGMASYGRGHGLRDSCALHTARLSCDTLVDFWSALGEETRQSLLRMKEEDFIERLMYRFDSKRFCRDCRRNVTREFKELKELKRMRREPRCTPWFCVADTAFQYEVSIDSVKADWRQNFTETAGLYHHFEWAIGTGEGKSDILEFENVGMNGSVQVNGLDLHGLTACYITLRAFKLDGRCSEMSVKAHALKGQPCVHCRLVVGDGYVLIKKGESIRRFFEHAEEAEEEEDDDFVDKDGNEYDGECSRPQKHAKSPELAREFLLDAATVIFKEQVEKAFREGTARQNAHSIFVCLALTLLEQRVHVACKEIITLEKQTKLLEEEENEKREEEERKERKRTKDREKKLRRKERLKEKERGKEKKNSESEDKATMADISRGEDSLDFNNDTIICKETVNQTEDIDLSPPDPPNDHQDEQWLDVCQETTDGEIINIEDDGYLRSDQPKPVHRKAKFWKEVQPDHALKWSSDKHRCSENAAASVSRSETRYRNDRVQVSSRCFNGSNRQLRVKASKGNDKFQCTGNRIGDKYDFHSCSCKQKLEYREKVEPNISATKGSREPKPLLDASQPIYRDNRSSQTEYVCELRLKAKASIGRVSSGKESLNSKKVWEPMEPKMSRPSNSDSDVTSRCSRLKVEEIEDNSTGVRSSAAALSPSKEKLANGNIHKEEDRPIEVDVEGKSDWHLKDPMSSTSNSDNCSSCLSEGDSNTNSGNTESSSTSDSEDLSQHSDERWNSMGTQTDIVDKKMADKEKIIKMEKVSERMNLASLSTDNGGSKSSGLASTTSSHNMDNTASQPQGVFPQMLNHNIQFPMFQAPSAMSYYHQAPVTWPTAPANGLMAFPPPSHYLYAGPLGYGLNGGDSQLCMQYGGPLNHSATPFFSPVPVFHPFAKTSSAASGEERAQSLEPVGGRSMKEGEDEKERKGGGKDPSCGNAASVDSFSLFHFGGPVALSAGCKSTSSLSTDAGMGDFAMQFSADHVTGNLTCKKEEKESRVEEYNLFAATNGITFSLF